jgi:outer membrane biogenesis lipoprotein LolB
MSRVFNVLSIFFLLATISACGPVPPPANAYRLAPDILAGLKTKRAGITSFRITGRVDQFGEAHLVQGKTYFFSVLPRKLRIELVSPFGSPLTVLTVNEQAFAMHDVREAKFYEGPAEPCNIGRLIRVQLPADDVIRILIGHTPLIDGESKVVWDRNGFYRVTITNGFQTQTLRIEGDHAALPLLQSTLTDKDGIIFDITYSRWQAVKEILMPHEIRVKMPREKADLLIRYDVGGVELNVSLPDDAWNQSPPANITPERVDCNEPGA